MLGCILGDQQLGLKVVMQGYQEAGLQRQVRTSGGRNPAQVYAHFISSYTFCIKTNKLYIFFLAWEKFSHNAYFFFFNTQGKYPHTIHIPCYIHSILQFVVISFRPCLVSHPLAHPLPSCSRSIQSSAGRIW